MRDGFEDLAAGQTRLTYPLGEGPAIGGGIEIAPGVVWMRMPLGGSLAFINVWGLKDAGGWTLVDTGREAPADGIEFYRAAGWDESALDNYATRFGGFGKALHALPDSFRRLVEGETLTIGGRAWRVVTGSGHSPEHACLYCPELKLFISGDQVLPKITSNVSVFPTEPEGDPLDDWLTSLARIKTLAPDDVLVLPAHNDPFRGLHTRIDQLIGFHEEALARLETALTDGPKRAIDVFGLLFKRQINENVLSMATGESLAHLNCLMRRGAAVRERDAAGVDWYRAAPKEGTAA